MKRVSSYIPQGLTIKIKNNAEVSDTLKGKTGVLMSVDESDWPYLYSLAIDGKIHIFEEDDLVL